MADLVRCGAAGAWPWLLLVTDWGGKQTVTHVKSERRARRDARQLAADRLVVSVSVYRSTERVYRRSRRERVL